MTELIPKNAFAGILGADGTHALTVNGTTIAPVLGRETAFVSPLGGRRADCEAVLEKLTGVAAPGPLRTSEGNGYLIVWTEPDQWLVRRAEGEPPLCAELGERFGACAAVFGASHGRVTIEVSGDDIAWILAKLAGLDFHREVFRTGMAQTTMVAHVAALIRRSGETTFELTCMRSYVRSTIELLVEACKDG